jgi:hypothetical protein
MRTWERGVSKRSQETDVESEHNLPYPGDASAALPPEHVNSIRQILPTIEPVQQIIAPHDGSPENLGGIACSGVLRVRAPKRTPPRTHFP